MDSVGELASKNEERETVVKVDQEIGQNSGEIQSIKDDVGIAHVEAMAIFQDGMSALIKEDPLLQDLPPAVTLEEVNSQIALEYGQAMTVFVRREDDVVLPIVVVSSASVLDLKKAIQRHMTLKLERQGHDGIVSWTYIWKRYCLIFEGQKLLDNNKSLKEYGIRNKKEVSFMKQLHKK